MALIPISKEIPYRTRLALQKLADQLDKDKSPTFAGLTLTGLTQGSVPFAGSAGLISQDNSNLSYDSANDVLSIGTTITLIGSDSNTIMYCDVDSFYITETTTAPVAGNPYGLLLLFTYPS